MDEETEKNVKNFVIDAAERIITMKTILELARARYEGLLHWLGLPEDTHQEYQPKKLVDIFSKLGKEFDDSLAKIDKNNSITPRKRLKKLRESMRKKVPREDNGERNSIRNSIRDKLSIKRKH